MNKTQNTHYVITLDWARDFETGLSIVAVEHSLQKAKEVFAKEVKRERSIAEDNGWMIYEDDDQMFDAGEEGSHIQDHTTVYLTPVVAETEEELWCITTTADGNDVMYLGWQNPAWDEDGYFWTQKETISEILQNNTVDHPFLFHSREAAIMRLKGMKLPQNCKVVR